MADELDQLAVVFRNLGADEHQSVVMAAQMLKRADQIAAQRGVTKAAALKGLLDIVIAGRSGETPKGFEGEGGDRENRDGSPT